jgi:predicted TIM-barrel fold metal-dependent hydrolase
MSCTVKFHDHIESFKEDVCTIPSIDAHIHMVDFMQETDGALYLMQKMNEAKIEKAVIFGLSVRKKWDCIDIKQPHYYLDNNSKCYYFSGTDEIVASEYLKLPAKDQKRISPMINGFNPTDKYSVHYVEKMLEKYPFFKGIGELLLRHDDLTNLITEETARINHPALFPIYELCAQKKMPIIFHQNSSSIGIHDEFEYLNEITEALDNFPNTNFIWAHCGISRRIYNKNYVEMIDKMMMKYKNLYADISWIIFDQLICENTIPKSEWIKLVDKYSDRFFIGSDLCGHYDYLGKSMARYNLFLSELRKDSAQRVAYDNAEKMWFS